MNHCPDHCLFASSPFQVWKGELIFLLVHLRWVSTLTFACYLFLFRHRLYGKHRFSLFFFCEIRIIPCLKEIIKHIFSYPFFISAALPFYLFLSVRFQVFIRLAEMLVSEETVVCGKRRRVCGCQYQVFVAIDKSTFSLCISSP